MKQKDTIQNLRMRKLKGLQKKYIFNITKWFLGKHNIYENYPAQKIFSHGKLHNNNIHQE